MDTQLTRPTRSLIFKATANLGKSLPPRISLKDGRFTVLQADGQRKMEIPPSLWLDVIVVGANEHVSRIYYEDRKDAAEDGDDAVSAPICFSDNGVAPSVEALTPQNPTCSGCPRAQWTKINGKGHKVPWCKSSKKLAVVIAAEGSDDTVYLLDVPPVSMKGPMKQYFDGLAYQKTEPYDVITHLTYENMTLGFESAGHLPDELKPAIYAIVDSSAVDMVVGEKDKAIEGMPRQIEARRIDTPPAPAIPHQEPFTVRQPTAPMTAAQAEASTPKRPRGRPPMNRVEAVVGPAPINSNAFAAQRAQDYPVQTPEGLGSKPFIHPDPAPAAPRGGIETPQPVPGELNAMLTKAFGLRLKPAAERLE